eukprot:CAMPEP_0195157914 /NCGR_PEP_ID=MMETSP0448-20130528/185403_1 /TAXON_ID=66468 /ORGANISM="Heterocapsa triquestra, Strain CCMP 448" /LENGTH=365 /DNA_ID=CAMNT_0040196709 /DNA_START=98 /DNA_END=1195 /DNA_ORIENTATION=+
MTGTMSLRCPAEGKLRLWVPDGYATHQPISSLGTDLGPWTVPTKEELLPILQNRRLIFIGDSLSGQEHDAAALLLGCAAALTCQTRGWATEMFFPELNLTLRHVRANFLVAESLALHAASNNWYRNDLGEKVQIRDQGKTQYVAMENIRVHPEMAQFAASPNTVFIINYGHWISGAASNNWYRNDLGEKVQIRDQGKTQYVDMENIRVHPEMSHFAGSPGTVFIINFGHWISGHRGDAYFAQNGRQLPYSPAVRMEIYRNLTRYVAQWSELNLHSDSMVIWHGYQGLSSWSQAQQDGLRGGLAAAGCAPGRQRQFFVSLDSLTSNAQDSLARGMHADGPHWQLPGVPDIEAYFVFRKIQEFAAAR